MQATKNLGEMADRLKSAEDFASSTKIQVDELHSENIKAGVELAALKGENRDLANQVREGEK